MNKKVIISLVLVALMGFGTAIGTYAWFTSQATSNDNVFTAGTLTVGLNTNELEGVEKNFAVTGNLQPGDTITRDAIGNAGYAKIEIVNEGNLDLFYFDNFVLKGNDKLAEAIIIKNWKNALYENATTIASDRWPDHFIQDGVFQYGHYRNDYNEDGIMDNSVDYNGDGKLSLAEWLDARNTQMGPEKGWDFGVLKPGAKFVQEFELVFDEAAGNEFKGAQLTGMFKAVATQFKPAAIDDLMAKQAIPYTVPGSTIVTQQTITDRYAEQ
ncbi:MAG TPA: TasA family protein [Patescibacteria group bacterium]|nr:TasA family protein [Patescibacteria group bacterium]